LIGEALSYLVVKTGRHTQVLPVRAYSDPKHVRAVAQRLRWKILLEVSREALCAKDLAKKLNTSEQAVCYHIRRLERSRLIRLERTERRRGAVARYYTSNVTAVSLIPDTAEKGPRKLEVEPTFLERCSVVLDPFISRGINFTVVVGSPTEHGEYRARARDGHHAASLMFFLGSLLPPTRAFVVRLDTEMNEHLAKSNLIVVGGPRVNTVAARINGELPIRFSLTNDGGMISSISGRSYHDDEDGLICMVDNPLNVRSKILVLAGNTHLGTAASVIGLVKHTERVAEGNSLSKEKIARVVRGLDLDSDGLIDDVKFLE
jgi:DNA-binding transcriptional ArsR family regulator